MKPRGAPRPVWIVGVLLVGCAAPHFVHATIPEPYDRGAAAVVEARSGQSDAILLRRSRLYFQRDDATFVRVVPGIGDRDVRIERHYSTVGGRPVLVLTATEVTTDDFPTRLQWVRYRRVVGSGVVEVEANEEVETEGDRRRGRRPARGARSGSSACSRRRTSSRAPE